MMEVAAGYELDVWEDVVDSEDGGVARVAGAEVPAGWRGLDDLIAEDSQFWIVFN